MNELLPTQFDEDRKLKVWGRLLARICRAINAVKPTFGWGLKAEQTDSGIFLEVDPDQIRDPQLARMQVKFFAQTVDTSYPDVVVAHPVGQPDDLRYVSIATPELKQALLDSDASSPSYENAYDEYIETVWRTTGAVRFVAWRLESPTGNFALDQFGNRVNVYWLAESARIVDLVVNEVSGDPWIDVSFEAIDLGQQDEFGDTIYSIVSKIKHKEITDYNTALTGETDQNLCRFTFSSPVLSLTPVVAKRDDAGHIHSFTEGSTTNINVGSGGGTDEKVSSQTGQTPGYLEDVAVLAAGELWIDINTNGAVVEWSHNDPNGIAEDYSVTLESDDAAAGGAEWITVTPDVGAAVLSFDARGHERDVAGGNKRINFTHNNPQATVNTVDAVPQVQVTTGTTVAIASTSYTFDAKGHYTGGVSTENRSIEFLGDTFLSPTTINDGDGVDVTYAHNVAGSGTPTHSVVAGNGIELSRTFEFDEAGHFYPSGGTIEVSAAGAGSGDGASVVNLEIRATDSATAGTTITVDTDNYAGRLIHYVYFGPSSSTDAEWTTNAAWTAGVETNEAFIPQSTGSDFTLVSGGGIKLFTDQSDGNKLKAEVENTPAAGRHHNLVLIITKGARKTTADYTISS